MTPPSIRRPRRRGRSTTVLVVCVLALIAIIVAATIIIWRSGGSKPAGNAKAVTTTSAASQSPATDAPAVSDTPTNQPSPSPSTKAPSAKPAGGGTSGCRASATTVPVIVWLRHDNGVQPFRELATNARHICIASPFWFKIEQPGRLTTLVDSTQQQLARKAQAAGTQLWPAVINLNGRPDIMEQTLNDPAKQSQLVDAITTAAVQQHFEGIDLDLEAIPLAGWPEGRIMSLQPKFNGFIRQLAGKLHRAGKKLSVTAMPRASSGDAAHRRFFDYQALSNAGADQVRSMSYPEHSGSVAGPLASPDYVKGHLDYELTHLKQPGKLVLGVPTYGEGFGNGPNSLIFYAQAKRLIGAGAQAQREGFEVTLTANGVKYYVSDACTVAARLHQLIATAKQHGLAPDQIGGLAVFRLGGTAPGTWSALAGQQPTASQCLAPPPQ